MPSGTPRQGSNAPDRAGALHALLALVNRFRHQQTPHEKIFVQRRPVDPDAAANQPPIAESLGAGITQLRETLERHANRPAPSSRWTTSSPARISTRTALGCSGAEILTPFLPGRSGFQGRQRTSMEASFAASASLHELNLRTPGVLLIGHSPDAIDESPKAMRKFSGSSRGRGGGPGMSSTE